MMYTGSDVNKQFDGKQQSAMTVGNFIDERITNTRQHLEELCILKAKADTAGLLDFPYQFIRDIV